MPPIRGDGAGLTGFLRAAQHRAKQRGDQFGEIVSGDIRTVSRFRLCLGGGGCLPITCKSDLEKAVMQSITASSTANVRIMCLFLIVGTSIVSGISGDLLFHHPSGREIMPLA